MKNDTDRFRSDSQYESFLLSGPVAPSGVYTTEISYDSEHRLTISSLGDITDDSQLYLLLLNPNDRSSRHIFPAALTNKTITVDFSHIPSGLFEQNTVWTCYLAYGSGGFIKQLKRKGTPAYSKKLFRITKPNQACLWHDEGRYYPAVATAVLEDGSEYGLAPFFHRSQNTLFLERRKTAEIENNCRTGNLYHRDKQLWHNPKHPYEFSVIMAIYMVEDYLEEAIESIIQQDIGFEQNVQLILVDDGSPDRSGEICDRYAEQYPNNIVVVHKKNGGVSSARNDGLKLATGKYVNFCDSDDKFSLNTLSTVKRFFDARFDLIDVVSIPLFFFEAAEGSHWQNYKFEEGTRVINLWKEYTISDMNCTSSFFKAEVAKKFSFDTTLAVAEDAKYVAQILLEKMQLGVVTECHYWYRQREAGGSSLNTARNKKSWYFEFFDNFVFGLEKYSQQKYGYVPYFIQNTLMMNVQWRFIQKEIPDGVLTAWEKRKYRGKVVKALQSIDDQIILEQRNLKLEHLAQLFQMKYKKPLQCHYTWNNVHLTTPSGLYIKPLSFALTRIDFIEWNRDSIKIEGSTAIAGLEDAREIKVFLMAKNNYYECRLIPRELDKHNPFGRLNKVIAFCGEIPCADAYGAIIRVAVQWDDALIIKRVYTYSKFCPVTAVLETQYYCKYGHVMYGRKKGIQIEKMQMAEEEYEKAFSEEIITLAEDINEDFPQPESALELTTERAEAILSLRKQAKARKREKPIWLIMDRIDSAGDNGEALFTFLMQQPDLPVAPYFVISEDCADYDKMKAIGPVLALDSREYLLAHLCADLIISSHAEEYILNPFKLEGRYFRDMMAEQAFVFLQHGITKDDLSSWLNRYNKNIQGFITATERERQSILDYDYYYEEDAVWLTGFPRHDYLYEDSKKQVVICPTWRLYLRDLTEDQFAESEYFHYYEKLMSNDKLHKALAKYGYTMAIKLHPNMLQFIELFEAIEGVELLNTDVPYRQIYAESDLMVTDYSSTAMDFAFMKKPVVYYQFDKDSFFSGEHTYQKGYFDYERDGFGKVTTTVSQTVDAIIDALKNGCTLRGKYKKRADDFFLPNDRKSCQRVYENLLKLQEKQNKKDR